MAKWPEPTFIWPWLKMPILREHASCPTAHKDTPPVQLLVRTRLLSNCLWGHTSCPTACEDTPPVQLLVRTCLLSNCLWWCASCPTACDDAPPVQLLVMMRLLSNYYAVCIEMHCTAACVTWRWLGLSEQFSVWLSVQTHSCMALMRAYVHTLMYVLTVTSELCWQQVLVSTTR